MNASWDFSQKLAFLSHKKSTKIDWRFTLTPFSNDLNDAKHAYLVSVCSVTLFPKCFRQGLRSDLMLVLQFSGSTEVPNHIGIAVR